VRITKRGVSLKIGLIGATALVLPLIGVAKAGADYAATPNDYVGVGGDTPQFSADFLANGDPDGDPGFNAAGPIARLITFDAESDANGRASYYAADSGSGQSGQNEYPTDVLRDGYTPAQRVSSSGNAISTLENDTSTTGGGPGGEDINFIFSSSALSSSTNYAVALHEYEFGTDTVGLAAATGSVAPEGLTIADLTNIYNGNYTTWSQITDVSGFTGSATTPIIPLLPPKSSAITTTFLGNIGLYNSTTKTFSALGANVQFVEQNDPNAITLATSAASGSVAAGTAIDAIVPFSVARYNLLEGTGNTHGTLGSSSPYFPAIPGDSSFLSTDAGLAYPTQPKYTAPIQILTTPASKTVTDYVDIRQSDLNDPVTTTVVGGVTVPGQPYEPGASINWAQYFFAGVNVGGSGQVLPYIDSGAAQALIQESGVTPHWADAGEFS